MKFYNLFSWFLLLVITLEIAEGADDTYNTIHRDGSYEFGYNNPDSYHFADANRNNVVKGEFGGRNPGTGAFDSTVYTAGPRGFRPRGKNVARKYDLSQSGPRPVGSPDDPYYDPYEDPSYSFSFRTRTYNRQENANRAGDVSGKYSYIDDVGERHNVEFIAGKNTGFHVKTPFPDSNPNAYGPLYFNGRGKPIPRGRTSIQRGTDGSYKFVSAGPDQRRTETSDATGHVRGSYTYLDDKGVQHSVHYIAGPETGYRVLKNVKGPHLPTVFPFGRPEIIPPDFYDYDKDVFDTAAAGHIKPGSGRPAGGRPGAGRPGIGGLGEDRPSGSSSVEDDLGVGKPGTSRPGVSRPGAGRPGAGRPGAGRPGAGRPGGLRPSVGGDISDESKPGSKEDSIDFNKNKDRDEFTFGNKKPSSKPFDVAYSDDDTGDFDDLFEGGGAKPGGTGSSSVAAGSSGASSTTRPNIPIPTPSQGSNKPDKDSEEDDGSYKPSAEVGSYKPIPTRPSFGNLPRPGGFTTLSTVRPTISGVRPSKIPTINVDYDGGYGAGKPDLGGGEEGSNEVGDFGLFGSETGNARPPYGNRPVIHVGSTDEACKKCAGTIVTNVGDKPFNVPPGVSVRAHVQAIDLLPISPSVPSPSEQYKADTTKRTEQLNEASNQVVSSNVTESKTEKTVTESTVTTTLVPNT